METPSDVESYLDSLDDTNRAAFAARVLAGVDPTKENHATFFNELKEWNESSHDELLCNAADRQEAIDDEENETGESVG